MPIPQCPCTRASIEQVARLLSRAGEDAVPAHVFLYRPTSADPNFIQTQLKIEAERIPGVVVIEDVEGSIAAVFGAKVSGTSCFYDAKGALRFEGGLTSSRGHVGDTRATDLLLRLMRGTERAGENRAPVYGCEIQTKDFG